MVAALHESAGHHTDGEGGGGALSSVSAQAGALAV